MHKPMFRNKSQILMICLLFSLFITDKILARNHWTGDYIQVSWVPNGNYILIGFEFFDFYFGPANENGYLERCHFEYSTDGENYLPLMSVQTEDQYLSVIEQNTETWTTMTDKLPGANLVFTRNFYPSKDTLWPDNTDYSVSSLGGYYLACIYMKWYVENTYRDVKYIRVSGKWHVNGVWPNEYFSNVVYPVNIQLQSCVESCKQVDSVSRFKTKINSDNSNNSCVNLYPQADEIIIKGATIGTSIQVYSTSGKEIKSMAADRDLVKIKLSTNQIYFVHIGQACYKVAL